MEEIPELNKILFMKAKCKICGEVEVTHFEGQDGELAIPVELCPTLKDLGKYYRELCGSSYEKNTGNKLKESFEKYPMICSHESFDDVGFEEANKHLLEPINCWNEIV